MIDGGGKSSMALFRHNTAHMQNVYMHAYYSVQVRKGRTIHVTGRFVGSNGSDSQNPVKWGRV